MARASRKTSRLARVFYFVLAGFSLVGCSKHDTEENVGASASSTDAPSVDASTALTFHKLDDPKIALINLNATITHYEKLVDTSPGDSQSAAQLVEALLSHQQFAGKMADLDEADRVSSALVAKSPNDSRAQLTRASSLGAVHKFDQALAAIALAEKRGADTDKCNDARATIFQAVGRYDEAAAIRNAPDEKLQLTAPLTVRATLAAEMQRLEDAERMFEEARAKYRDVSPFAVAWMDFRRGSVYERNGDREKAKKYFAEANQILPTYTHASVHLAALETPERAVAILTPLVDSTDDPDVLAGLADALRRSGKTADATAMHTRAQTRYEELLAKYPEAFADHAAAFFLGPNGDVPRALSLAQANEKIRKTEPAIELLLTPAMASNNHAAMCAAAADGAALKYASTAFRANIAPLLAGCGIDAGVK
jgi:tetratricopeptide (TPR) repeat protein